MELRTWPTSIVIVPPAVAGRPLNTLFPYFMLGNWGPKGSRYLLRHVRIGLINSHLNGNSRHISSKFAKQSSPWSLAPSKGNSRPSAGLGLYKTHNTIPLRHAQGYATFRGRSVNWRKRKIIWGLVAGVGAFGYYIYYELSFRWSVCQLKFFDEDHFPFVNWDSPLETMAYFRYLEDVCSRDRNQTVQQAMMAEFSPKQREQIQELLQVIGEFVYLPREELEPLVKRMAILLQVEDMDSFVSTLVASQRQMHKTMKEAAHQVHDLLEHPLQWESRTLGYDMRKIAFVVYKANHTLFKLAMEGGARNFFIWCVIIFQEFYKEEASNAITTGSEER
ncbi:hypothetical protein BDP27DRAFT_1345305 [Rhodocollybia butyracea]|uniref:Uncharacterized protein n=1 Tax=Rhodocollybia butyracea TaxID=206335 RepID=A0A9P5P6T8_9AGAR|nr:hypothetical protein BDP27DRAFT_1345305 [Rhodocollybia butyracea]